MASEEIYRPTDARICQKAEVVLCADCVDVNPDGQGNSSNLVSSVLWEPLEGSVWRYFLRVAHVRGYEVAGAHIANAAVVKFPNCDEVRKLCI